MGKNISNENNKIHEIPVDDTHLYMLKDIFISHAHKQFNEDSIKTRINIVSLIGKNGFIYENIYQYLRTHQI